MIDSCFEWLYMALIYKFHTCLRKEKGALVMHGAIFYNILDSSLHTEKPIKRYLIICE